MLIEIESRKVAAVCLFCFFLRVVRLQANWAGNHWKRDVKPVNTALFNPLSNHYAILNCKMHYLTFGAAKPSVRRGVFDTICWQMANNFSGRH